MKKLLIIAIVACVGLTALSSCTSEQATKADAPESRATAEMTVAEANAMVVDLQNNNTYIDFDIDALVNEGLDLNNRLPDIAKARVVLYRFYSGIAKENGHFVQKKTAAEMNISPRLYDYYMERIVASSNKSLDSYREQGMSEDEAFGHISDITNDEANRRVLVFD